MSHYSKSATPQSQRQSRYKLSKQTKITDYFQEHQTRNVDTPDRHLKVVEEQRKVSYEFDKSRYANCLSKLSGFDDRVLVVASYPLYGTTVPWHSVGVLRLMDDVNKILRAKGMREFKYPEFIDVLGMLQHLGLLRVVDGVVVNFKSCE